MRIKLGGNILAHIFLNKVFEYSLNNSECIDSNFIYNKKDGYWVDSDNSPCILNPNFAKPRTKKEDRETGEDKKGE